MGAFIDLSGERFGKLTVIRRNGTSIRGKIKTVKIPTWECKCECGNIVTVASRELRTGDTTSCGCIHREMVRNLCKSHGDGTPNSKYFRLYRIWFCMKKRCEDPNEASYKDYGSRGITVCSEWHNYEKFKGWSLCNGYSEDLTIDRIDNDKGYSPENCRWTDYTIQANNRRKCRYVEIDGETKTITEWCRIFKTNQFTAYSRIDDFNWDPVDAVKIPSTRKKVRT